MKAIPVIVALAAVVVMATGCAGTRAVSHALVTDMDSAREDQFKVEVFESEMPTVVLFTGKDCAPCRPVDKLIDKVAPEYDGWVRFLKLNTGSSEAVCKSAKVEALPTLVIYDGKKILDRRVGQVDKEDLRSMLNAALDIDAE